MGWPYVYGCNVHRGAEGDNSARQFGETRRKSNEPKKWTAVIRHTPISGHALAMTSARPFPVTQDKNSTGRLFYKEEKSKEKAKWNIRASPEMNVMHALSKGKLPSKRLRFHFPDLFPEVKEQEKAQPTKIFYVEPPRLVDSGSLAKWIVPSLPWRYLTDHSDHEPRGRLQLQATQRTDRLLTDVGCQTACHAGVLTDPMTLQPSPEAKENEKEVVVLESHHVTPVLADVSTQTCSRHMKRHLHIPRKSKTEKQTEKPIARRRRRARNVLAFSSGELPSKNALGDLSERGVIQTAASLDTHHEKPGDSLRAALDPRLIKATAAQNSEKDNSPTDSGEHIHPVAAPCCIANPSESKLLHSEQNPIRKPECSECGITTLQASSAPRITTIPSESEVRKTESKTPPPPAKNKRGKKRTAQNRARYSLRMSPKEKQEGEKNMSVQTRGDRKPTEKDSDKRGRHSDVASLGTGSSIESLEELERLIEEQHAQLVAKGLLPPDEELNFEDLHRSSATSTEEELSQASIEDAGAARGASDLGFGSESVMDDANCPLPQCSSDESSSHSASLARLEQSLEMPPADLTLKLNTDASSEMETSAAAIAAFARYHSQFKTVDDKEVVYDVSISKQQS